MTLTQRPRSSVPPAALNAVKVSTAATHNALIAAVMCGFVLMTLVVVVQARTIESQRALIRNLFADSAELRVLREARAAGKGSTPKAGGTAAAPGAPATRAVAPPAAPPAAPPTAKAVPTPTPPTAEVHPKLERQRRQKPVPVPPPSPPRAVGASDARFATRVS